MSLNVLGGGLEFDMSLNTDGFDSVLQSLNSKLAKLADPLQASLSDVDTALNALLTQLHKVGSDPSLDALVTKYAELQKQQLTLQDALGKTTDPGQIKDLNSQLADTATQMKDIATQTSAIAPPVDQVTQAYGRLRQIKNELVQLTIDGQRGSPEFEQFNDEAQTLTNNIRNTNKELALSANNVAGITALTEGAKGLVGAFQGVVGAIALFGGNSKEADEATKQVIATMGIF